MGYPYPIQDWTRAENYLKADALPLTSWAWEFLRRNPEYQRLFDLFQSLPDTVTLPDGSLSNKNGKWKGTPPCEFRFLTDGAAWYANPEPIRGESWDEYDARTGGVVLPFAEYLGGRFCIEPFPPDPRCELPKWCYFSDEWGADAIPPWEMELGPPPIERPELWSRREWENWRKRFEHLTTGPERVVLVFDVGRSLDAQLERAREMLTYYRETLGLAQVKRRRAQTAMFPSYVRLLDADAVGAPVPEIAAALYPGEEDSRGTGYRVSAKVRAALATARGLRDGDYWGMLA